MESKNTQVAFYLGVFASDDNNLVVEVISLDHVEVRMFGAKALSTT